jgi:L-threonylcarbamoyladenylate synthase
VIAEAIAAIRNGEVVVLPTDTVYGLAATADHASACAALYELKGRPAGQATALVAASVDVLLERVPELRGRAGQMVSAILPGPYTLVLANPARRYPWLAGAVTDTIGVRVPGLADEARHVLDAVGCLAATSANDPGGADPRTLADVPARLRDACAALDAGPLPGTPSTVIDFSGAEPRVLREGAAPSAEAIADVRRARVRSG